VGDGARAEDRSLQRCDGGRDRFGRGR
jgi:hypothetical protein